MTDRADQAIERLLTNPVDIDEVIPMLLADGFRITEIGWVLHHAFSLSMSEAVHRAIVTRSQLERQVLS